MNYRLSICICSLESRQTSLQLLLDSLDQQNNGTLVQILTDVDDGSISIGQKRNQLVDKATGDYIAFIDDDDAVADDYIIKIIGATETRPDCCGIEGIITTDGGNPRKFIHSIKFDKWSFEDNIYHRYPNHLNPIKSDIIRSIRFPEINHGEDRDFSDKIRQLLKTEVYIDNPIYYYRYIRKPRH